MGISAWLRLRLRASPPESSRRPGAGRSAPPPSGPSAPPASVPRRRPAGVVAGGARGVRRLVSALLVLPLLAVLATHAAAQVQVPATATVTEGGTLTITLSGDPGQNSTISAGATTQNPVSAVVGTTCNAGIDAVNSVQDLNLSAGTSTHTLSASIICDDSDTESSETFQLTWSSNPPVFDASAANCGTASLCGTVVTIEDNDAPPFTVTLSTPDKVADEGDLTDKARIRLDLTRGLVNTENITAQLRITGGNQNFSLALDGSPTGVNLSSGHTFPTFTAYSMTFSDGSPASATLLLTHTADTNTTDDDVTATLHSVTSTNLGTVQTSTVGNGVITLLDSSGHGVKVSESALSVDTGAHLLHLLQGGEDALGLAPAAALRGLGLDGPNVAVEHRLEALDDVARVGEAAADEVGEERGCVGSERLDWLHGAVSFVPVRESGGRTSSPGHPPAAPLTAKLFLSAEQGARLETGAGWRCGTGEAAAPADGRRKAGALRGDPPRAACQGGVTARLGRRRSGGFGVLTCLGKMSARRLSATLSAADFTDCGARWA